MNSFDFPTNEAKRKMIQRHDSQMRDAEQWLATCSPYRLQVITGAIGMATTEDDTSPLICLPPAELEFVARLAQLSLHELVLRNHAAQESRGEYESDSDGSG